MSEISAHGNPIFNVLSQTRNMLNIKFNEFICKVGTDNATTQNLIQQLIDISSNEILYDSICLPDGTIIKQYTTINKTTNQVVNTMYLTLDNLPYTGDLTVLKDMICGCNSSQKSVNSNTVSVCVDGKNWTKTLVFDNENGNYSKTIWNNELGIEELEAPSILLIDNEACRCPCPPVVLVSLEDEELFSPNQGETVLTLIKHSTIVSIISAHRNGIEMIEGIDYNLIGSNVELILPVGNSSNAQETETFLIKYKYQ